MLLFLSYFSIGCMPAAETPLLLEFLPHLVAQGIVLILSIGLGLAAAKMIAGVRAPSIA